MHIFSAREPAAHRPRFKSHPEARSTGRGEVAIQRRTLGDFPMFISAPAGVAAATASGSWHVHLWFRAGAQLGLSLRRG